MGFVLYYEKKKRLTPQNEARLDALYRLLIAYKSIIYNPQLQAVLTRHVT